MKEQAYRKQRKRMVRTQLEPRGIVDERVLDVMREVPRHRFVPPAYRDMAYADAPLPIGHHQTISQPYIVALMTQLLQLTEQDRVLEVGTGSGYQAAVLSRIVDDVVSLERIPALVEQSRQLLSELGYDNVMVIQGDGSSGAGDEGLFDAITITAAAPALPDPLKDALKDGGRLVIPVGSRFSQSLQRWTREGDTWRCEDIAPVAFVPLMGQHGWQEDTR